MKSSPEFDPGREKVRAVRGKGPNFENYARRGRGEGGKREARVASDSEATREVACREKESRQIARLKGREQGG